MNYASELKKFISSQYIYAGVRTALAIVVPSVVLAHFGLLKEYFLFPLGTSFIALTDLPGPFIRRRNSLIFASISFFFVALVASLVKDFQILIFLEIIIFGMFFSMIGVYGQRLASVGSLALVVMAIFIDGHLTGNQIFKNLLIFLAGCIWFIVIFFIVSIIRPYKLISQMIGENYLELANYLKIKSKFYQKNPDYDEIYSEIISQQIKIKDLQEATRETAFKTRTIVNESTTTSRILMLMFLNSIDLHEKLMTSENDYQKLQKNFGNNEILEKISNYLNILSNDLENIGIALQSGTKAKPSAHLNEELNEIYEDFFNLRNSQLNSETLEDFMILRQILKRLSEYRDEVKSYYKIFSQDVKFAKSLSTGLDLARFLPKEEKLNRKVFFENFSLKSSHFRHALRITVALLLGYLFSKLKFLGIGHSYWILITVTAILKPAYSTTKSRNLLRIFGTIAGAIFAYVVLFLTNDNAILLFVLFVSMILCFSFLRGRYFWAVFFMTTYIFLAFNFLNPGNVNAIFKDRILDTAIGGMIAFLVSYFVFPVWEHTQNLDLMKKSAKSNLNYFEDVIFKLILQDYNVQNYKLKRKEAIINLANLSDNFQRMISDPKNQQKELENVHQFVSTSHLLTAYIASLSHFSENSENFPEIDFESWEKKISAELARTISILNHEDLDNSLKTDSKIEPEDLVDELLEKRKSEIDENEIYNTRDPKKITRLTRLKNIQEILELLYEVSKEQRKIVEKFKF